MIEALYAKYRTELLNWLCSMTRDRNTAEELLQETFLRAMRSTELLLMLEEGQRRAWLYRTAKHLYIDRVRKNTFETVMEAVPEQADMQDQAETLVLMQLLELLPEEEQALFELRYLQGYNSTELGQIMRCPPGTIRAKLASARKHLREMLDMDRKSSCESEKEKGYV